MLTGIANHLWQSTLFALVAILLSFALRKNQARTRHTIWMLASLKFLVPFSLLVSAGSHVPRRTSAPVTQPASLVLEKISQPFPNPTVAVTAHPATNWQALALALWLCGCGAVLGNWSIRWKRVRSAARLATRAKIDAPIEIKFSPALMEPGIFGILRPVLLLPQGIAERLTTQQFDAIIAHELCHVRRRDNLTSALHMLVEATFWFHPLVWWIGARLVEERENACDEEVLHLGKDPQVYAESILRVCQLYLESPLVCVSGITGADLKQRIEAIMTRGIGEKLGLGRKLMLAALAITAVVGPLAIGFLHAPPLRAQTLLTGQPRLKFETGRSNRATPAASASATRMDHPGREELRPKATCWG